MKLLDVRNRLRDGVVKRMTGVADRVTGGSAGDFSAYKQMIGRMQGHNDALDEIDAVFKSLLDEEDAD